MSALRSACGLKRALPRLSLPTDFRVPLLPSKHALSGRQFGSAL